MTTTRTMTVTVDARRYEDEDDSLRAAADDVRRDLGLRGWSLNERWGDDATRETIQLTIPAPKSNDASGWDRLRALDCISAVETGARR